jgi:hypothetical protein
LNIQKPSHQFFTLLIKNSRAAALRDFGGFDFQLSAQQCRQGKSERERENSAGG